MDSLIEALTIFNKYGVGENPTHCEHYVLTINLDYPHAVAAKDKTRLNELGFHIGAPWGEDTWLSYRFGSA